MTSEKKLFYAYEKFPKENNVLEKKIKREKILE